MLQNNVEKEKQSKRKGYFYEKEEQAIIDYINASTLQEKNKIFSNVLYPALTTMIEAIIRRYKLFIPDEEYYQTFSDVFSYLITKINNFDPAKGCKAYSYCGTVCKNYLYWKSTQYRKNLNRSIPFDDVFDSINETLKYEEYDDESRKSSTRLIKKIKVEIQKMIDEPELNRLTENDIKVGQSLIRLFDNWQSIFEEDGSNKLRKSDMLYYLCEDTMLSADQVRKGLKPFKLVYGLVRIIHNKEENS